MCYVLGLRGRARYVVPGASTPVGDRRLVVARFGGFKG